MRNISVPRAVITLRSVEGQRKAWLVEKFSLIGSRYIHQEFSRKLAGAGEVWRTG